MSRTNRGRQPPARGWRQLSQSARAERMRLSRESWLAWILCTRLVPERVDFDRLGSDDPICRAEAAHDPRVASFIPRPNRYFTSNDDIARRQDEGVITVRIKNERPLVYHERGTRLRYDSNSREHLRFELQAAIFNLATELERVSVGINTRADPIDHAAEHLVRVRGGHGLDALSNMHARKVVLVNVGREPYPIERCDREQIIAGIHLCAAHGLLLRDDAADWSPHP